MNTLKSWWNEKKHCVLCRTW